ncbi:MAG: hypothetical protein PHQ34_09575 [Methanothrix sp.]|nr:hypothetical protein [Methanothrix sp.]
MNLLHIISILLLLAGTGLGEDLIFFADDHYKSLGRPELAASVVNPILLPGESTLQISLANGGELKELIPINESGEHDDILQEMMAETKSCDALNIVAALGSAPSIRVTDPSQSLGALPAGFAARLRFNITAEKNASGWYALPLLLDYERQVDASAKNGEVFPLYEAEQQNITCNVFVSGSDRTLHILAVQSRLYAGGSASISIALSNDGFTVLRNCSVRLLAAPPFYAESPAIFLGDLDPGSIHVLDFLVRTDANASPQDYQLGCEIFCQEKSIIVPFQITLSEAGFAGSFARSGSALPGLVIAGVTAFLLWRRRDRLTGRRKRRR